MNSNKARIVITFIPFLVITIAFLIGVARGYNLSGDTQWGGVPIQGVVLKPPFETGLYQIMFVKFPNSKQEVRVLASRYPLYAYGDVVDVFSIPDDEMWLFMPKVELVSHGGGNMFLRSIYKVRDSLKSYISVLYSEPYAKLIMGIAFGVKMDLGDEMEEQFSTAGVTHIMVASGYNVTIIVASVWALLSVFGVKRVVSRWTSVIVVLLFAVLAGLDPPVVRAAIMVVFLVVAELIGRQYHPLLILCYVAAGMLIIDPLLVDSLSYYLSIGATGAIFVIRPTIIKYFSLWPSLIREDLVTTLSVSAVTVPLIWLWLSKVQLAGLLTNLLILWTVPYITFGAVISLVVGSVSMSLARVVALGVTVLLKYMLIIVEVVVT